jgi:peptidoglycan/LPS O-acetylase OafA/YrhL
MLRALAALAVVTHHALEVSNGAAGRFSPDWLTTSGASGVDIFFVISGFIMLHVSFRPHRPPPPPGRFLLRRMTRIYPLYWLCCLAMLAAAAAGFLRGQAWSGADVATSLLLLPSDHLLVNVSWTLVYELYFYLIFAVMLLARSMAAAVIGASVSIVCLWLGAGLLPWPGLRSLLADPIPLEFCMGLCLAWATSRRTFRRSGIGWGLALIGLGVMTAAPLFVVHPDTSGLPGLPRVLAWGLPAVLVMMASLPIGPPRNPATRFAVLLGDASYALYLTHVFVMIGYGWVLKSTGFGAHSQVWAVPVVVLVSVVIAIGTHRLIERPILAIIRTVSARGRLVGYNAL